MKEPQEFIPDEDLKSFFLTGTLFLNLSEELEQQEYNRLRMLYKLHKSVHDLLFHLYQCNLNMHCLDVCDVFGFYFVEKEGEKKHYMSVRLYACTRFIQQIIKYCDLGKVIIIFTNTVVGVILLYILLQMH